GLLTVIAGSRRLLGAPSIRVPCCLRSRRRPLRRWLVVLCRLRLPFLLGFLRCLEFLCLLGFLCFLGVLGPDAGAVAYHGDRRADGDGIALLHQQPLQGALVVCFELHGGLIGLDVGQSVSLVPLDADQLVLLCADPLIHGVR